MAGRARDVPFGFTSEQDRAYALSIIETVTWLGGRSDYLDELGDGGKDLDLFGSNGSGRSSKVFKWLMAALSYQGISDAVARSYMAAHEAPAWAKISRGVKNGACPLLESYWHFHGCGYRKTAKTCAKPDLMKACSVPAHVFRNGNLNQLAYSLLLFIRDVAGGDLVDWIDRRLAEAQVGPAEGRLSRMQHSIIEPLTGLHGASYKVLNMALSDLLLIGSARNPLWAEVATSLIAVDTLVHNFLVRTGILARARADHPYGPQCYGPAGCHSVLSTLSEAIDARQFNPGFPKIFPRYVQHAIWSYCAGEGLNVCNGNSIDDQDRCQNRECRLYADCDRIRLGRKISLGQKLQKTPVSSGF
jgi:hypothetical protein